MWGIDVLDLDTHQLDSHLHLPGKRVEGGARPVHHGGLDLRRAAAGCHHRPLRREALAAVLHRPL